MLLSIQFPFADSRRFIDDTGQLRVPNWPTPSANIEFVRYFGGIRTRKSGGLRGWVGENEICEADRAIRFVNAPPRRTSPLGYEAGFRCAFRRFYFDGEAVGKFEIGFHVETNADLTSEQTIDLFDYFLRLPVEVRDPVGEVHHGELAQAGRYLARLYRLASTVATHRDRPSPDWWVRAGQPLFLVQSKTFENLKIPYPTRPVALTKDLGHSLDFCLAPYAGGDIRTWMLGLDDAGDKERARTLRLYLLRLHAEHESLRLVLSNLKSMKLSVAPRSPASDELQRFFDRSTTHIGKLENKSAQNFDAQIAAIAGASMDVLSPGQREALIEDLNSLDFRGNLKKTVLDYIEQSGKVVIVHGDLVAGDKVQGDKVMGDKTEIDRASGRATT